MPDLKLRSSRSHWRGLCTPLLFFVVGASLLALDSSLDRIPADLDRSVLENLRAIERPGLDLEVCGPRANVRYFGPASDDTEAPEQAGSASSNPAQGSETKPLLPP